MDYNKEYAKKVYAGLKKRGYTDADLGEEELFVTRMGREENRRYLYDLVTERGDANIGSWERFNTRMTEQPTVESGGVIPYLENLSGIPYPQKELDKSQYTFTSSQLGIEEPKPVVSGKGVRGLDLSDVERPYTQKQEYGQTFDEAVENVEKFHRMRYGDGGTLVAPGVYKDGDVYRTAGGTAKKLINANYKAYKAQVESDITDMMALYEQIGATPYGQLDTSEWGKYVDAMELGGEGRSRGARKKQEWQNRMRESYLLPTKELPAEMSITKPQGYSAALRLLPILSLPEEEGKKILGEEGYNALKFFKAYNERFAQFNNEAEEDAARLGFAETMAQGFESMGRGAQYFIGEASNAKAGHKSSLDDKAIIDNWDEFFTEDGKLKSAPQMGFAGTNEIENRNINFKAGYPEVYKDYRDYIQDLLAENGNDIDKVKKIIKERSKDVTFGDKAIMDASEAINSFNPEMEGFGGLVAKSIPQMVGVLAAIVSGGAGAPALGSAIGVGNMGYLTASTMGQSMKEARDAGATNLETWLTGIANGVIELVTEKIPFDNWTKGILRTGKGKIAGELVESMTKNPAAREEFELLLKRSKKELDIPAFSGNNIKKYLAGVAAEGASEFTAEALQTLTKRIYENPEDYPTIMEAIKNGWEGAKAGLLMGAVTGAVVTSQQRRANDVRRKKQGFVEVASLEIDGRPYIGEIVGKTNDGGWVVTINGEDKVVKSGDIKDKVTFSYDEFRTGEIMHERQMAFDEGYSQEPTGEAAVNNIGALEAAENEVRRMLGLANDADIDVEVAKFELTDEEAKAVDNYRKAKARFEGTQQRFQETRDAQYAESDRSIDERSNNGMIYSVNTKDGVVYITGGNLVLKENGSIDYDNSEDLYAMFPDRTKKPVRDGMLLGEVTVQSAEEVKAAARMEIDNRWRNEFDTAEISAAEQEKRKKGLLFNLTDGVGDHTIEVLEEGADDSKILFDGKELSIGTDELNQWREEAGVQSNAPAVAPIPIEKRGKEERAAYHLAPIERTLEDLHDGALEPNEITALINARIKEAYNDVQALEKKKPTEPKKPVMGTSKEAYLVAKAKAKADYEKAQAEWQTSMDEAQQRLNYYNELYAREQEITKSETREAYDNVQPREVVEMTADEFIANNLPKITPESFKAETGLSNSEQAELVGYIAGADKGGVSVERAAEIIMESYGDELRGLGFQGDMQDVRDIIIDILSQGNPRSYAKSGIEQRRKDSINQQRAEIESVAALLGFESVEEWAAYEEQVIPGIIQMYTGFDYNEYYNNLAENYEYDTTREGETVGRGGELLQGEQLIDNTGAPVAEGNEGGAVPDSVQSDGANAQAPGDQQVNEPVGETEQLSSSEIPNNQSVTEGDAPGQSGVEEITNDERVEMEARIVDWLSEDNLERASGKTRDEIFNEFGNELEPIAYIPTQYISLVSQDLKDQRIYCGKGYFIDHALRNHAKGGKQLNAEDVDVSKYLNIQSVLDNPDSVKETYVDGKRTVVFIKKIGRYFAELTQVEEDGKIVLHKSMFDQKKEPYAKLNDIRSKGTSSEGGVSSISHTAEAAPAISLESRGDVVSNSTEPSASEDRNSVSNSQENAQESGENAENGGEKMYSPEELAEAKEQLGELNATSAPEFAARLFSIKPWKTLEEANAALKELLASYGETLNGQTAAVLPFLDEAQRLISENSKNQEPRSTEDEAPVTSETTERPETNEVANAGPVNMDTLQLNMSEEDFNALLSSGDKAAISEYLAEMDGLLRVGVGSPLNGRDDIVKEYRGLVEQYGGEDNIPADVVAGINERIAPYNALQRAIFDRKYALQDRLREIEATEQRAKELAEKEAKAEHKQTAFGGFLAGKTDLGASAAEKALNKKYDFDGKVMTVAEFVEEAVGNGDAKLSTIEEHKYKGASRAAWNRMDARQQEADAKRVKESGTKTVYTVNDHDLGKTAYDYAKFLLDKKAEQEKAAAKQMVKNLIQPFAKEKSEEIDEGKKVLDESENLTREGAGPLTDREVVMESDPYSKVLGKPRYYGQKQRNYVARQRARMAQKATELAEKLNLNNVEVLESTEGLTGKKATSKGWFDPRTGKITVVVPNHGSTGDIVETVLHEAVAHYGLRKLFGENFKNFLDNVYNNVTPEIREEITELAKKYGWDFHTATEEYLASLAENTNFEKVNPSLWSNIKSFFMKMLAKVGITLDEPLGDNELRYILWRSHQNLVAPDMYNNVFAIAENIVKQYELGVGNYASGEVKTENGEVAAEDEIRFSRVTPEMDAEYMAAVENGDMETAERLVKEAAKLAMPDTKVVDEDGYPMVVYHYSNNPNITIFNPFRRADDLSIKEFDELEKIRNSYNSGSHSLIRPFMGIWATPIRGEYKDYGKYEYALFADITNPRITNRVSPNLHGSKKHDGVFSYSNGVLLEVSTTLPEKFKSADAVTYDDNGNVIPLSERFNEEKEDIRFRKMNYDEAVQEAKNFEETHKGSAPIVVLDGIENWESEFVKAGVKQDEIERFRERLKTSSGNPKAAYLDDADLIFIFKPKVDEKDFNGYIWHENIHKAIREDDREGIPTLESALRKIFRDDFDVTIKEAEEHGYIGEEAYEELACQLVQVAYLEEKMNANGLKGHGVFQDFINPLIKKIYGRGRGIVHEGVFEESNRANEKEFQGGSLATTVDRRTGGGSETETQATGAAEGTRFRISEEVEADGSIDDVKTAPLTLMERITNSLLEVSAKNKENLELRADALRTYGRDLKDILKLMRAQREYDKSTVDQLVKLAKMYFKNAQLVGEVDTYTMGRILSVINDVVGRKDISANAEKLMDILMNAHNKALGEVLAKAEKVKPKKINASGVEVIGSLDMYGQEMVESYNAGKLINGKQLDDAISEAYNNLADKDREVRKEFNLDEDVDVEKFADEYIPTGEEPKDATIEDYKKSRASVQGYELAREYVDNIQSAVKEIADLEKELKDALMAKRKGEMSQEAYNEFRKSTMEAIFESKVGMIDAYHSLISKFSEGVRESGKRAKAFQQAQIDRVKAIQHNANSDMEGHPAKVQGKKPTRHNNAITRALMSPLGTFQTILEKFGEKAVDGKGYLYDRFMTQVTDAGHKEFEGIVAARATIEIKLKELFGKRFDTNKFCSRLREHCATISYIEAGKEHSFELTQGQALYIYMANKMTDGQMKLRKMGITEEVVASLVKELPEKMVLFADWVQDDLMVTLRGKYNAVHERLFGVSVAAIENYFPLKIRKEGIGEKKELGQDAEAKPSTITGAIIKRTKNSAALDLSADAMQVLFEHIDQMEHWAAFAEFNRDINSLINYRHFQNQVKSMTTLRYGSGDVLWKNFQNVVAIATETYKPERSEFDKAVLNITKGITRSKINFRLYTALKQVLSAPAFWNNAGVKELAFAYANPAGSIKWAMENLPGFKERWMSRSMGNEKLLNEESDWKVFRTKFVENATKWGMTSNAAVDVLTVAQGARAVYLTKLRQFKDAGYSEEQAGKKALQRAAESYNESQQSSEGAYLSAMQASGTAAAAIFTTFKNSSFGYTRKTAQAVANISRKMHAGYKKETIEFMKKKMMREGLTEEQAEKFATKIYYKSLYKDVADVALFGVGLGFLWNFGGMAIYLILGDDDDEKDKMWEEIAIRSLLDSLNGIPFGETAINAVMAAREGNMGNIRLPEFIAFGDIKNLAKVWDTDRVKFANDLINMLLAAGVGVEAKPLTDLLVAFGDMEDWSAEEFGLFALRTISAPSSQLDRLLVDDAMENNAANLEEVAMRYIQYKKGKDTPITGWMYSDKGEQEAAERYGKRFAKYLDERLENVVEDNDTFDVFYNSSEPGVKKSLSSMRQKFLAGENADRYQKFSSRNLIFDALEVLKGNLETSVEDATYFEMTDSEDVDAAYLMKSEMLKHEDVYKTWNKLKGMEKREYGRLHKKELYYYKGLKKKTDGISRYKSKMKKSPENAERYMTKIREKQTRAIELINDYNNE